MRMSKPARIYEDDFYTWTQQQAAALRKLTSAQVGNEVDLEHVVEEIEDLGNSECARVASNIWQLFLHLMKIAAEPQSADRRHWLGEIATFRIQAQKHYSPGMRQKIDFQSDWSSARKTFKRLNAEVEVIETCPFTLDQVLNEDFILEAVPLLKD